MIVNVKRRSLLAAFASGVALSTAPAAMAQLRIEISGVGANQIPVALVPMNGAAETGIDPMRIVQADLARTGAFRIIETQQESTLEESIRPDLAAWGAREANMLVTGSVIRLVNGSYEITYRLFDTVKNSLVDELKLVAKDRQLRMASHRIADRVYNKLTGLGELFCSRLAYVVQHRPDSFELIVADSDGANAAPALRSREPIISPTWSPDGSQLAYVSFEARKPVVYIHTVATGKRRVIANFRGNNSAPAFSPDGRQLAVALSRDGYTQIFLINTDGSGVKRFSHSYAIDTEPVFSPDGQYLYFTSDRGGSAQIYRHPLAGGPAQRVTFVSNYAVSPALNPAGTQLSYITRNDGRYCVAVMDIATGQEMILTSTALDESPCFAPNGSMIVYATERSRRGVLATISVDGAVHSWLTGPTGDIREPTWGPLLKF